MSLVASEEQKGFLLEGVPAMLQDAIISTLRVKGCVLVSITLLPQVSYTRQQIHKPLVRLRARSQIIGIRIMYNVFKVLVAMKFLVAMQMPPDTLYLNCT